MIAKEEVAACLVEQTAKIIKPLSIKYPEDVPLSSLKIKIGGVLLCLAAGQTQPGDWQQFDQLLRQLYEGSTL